MNDGNKRKASVLGISHGTASNRLRKMVMFSLLVKLGENFCYQCGDKILTSAELSLEHKKPWLRAENPVETFFDLDNVAFSHLSCNAGAAFSAKKRYYTEDEVREGYNRRSREYRARQPKEVKQKKRREKYLRLGI